MPLTKYKITYHLADHQAIEQILDGVSPESVESVVQQKLSQEHLILISSGTLGTQVPYTSIESRNVLRYKIEGIEEGRGVPTS
jgi:hypothetical protein